MRRAIACLFLLVAVPVLANEPGTLTIRDFSAGLVTSKDPSIIPDGAAQDMENVDVDEGSIVKRKGSILVNTTAIGADNSVRFLHEYVDPTNSFWLLAVSSNTLYGSTDGGASFAVLTSVKGISSTSRFQAANAFGKAYLVDGSTNAITFDGTTVAHNTNVPLGGVTAFFAGRLWVANGSNLYGSRVSDADDWTDDGVDDDEAFSAVVRNNDGYTITALKPFGPDLFVFKAKSIDRVVITGGGTDFNLYPVTSHLGTTHPDSVRATDNAVVWLAQDGYYSFDGSQIRRISDAITPTVEGITQLDALTRSYSETDMTAGTDDNTTAERVAGQVMLSTVSYTYTTGDDFSAGTLGTFFSTTTIPGSVSFINPSGNTGNVANNSFETGTLGGWSKTSAKISSSTLNPKSGSKHVRWTHASPVSNTLNYSLWYGADTYASGSVTLTGSYAQYSIPTTGLEGYSAYLSFWSDGETKETGLTKTGWQAISDDSNITFWAMATEGTPEYHDLDLVEGGIMTTAGGTYYSAVSTLTTPLVFESEPEKDLSYTQGSQVYLNVSTNGVNYWLIDLDLAPGEPIKYYLWRWSFFLPAGAKGFPSLSEVRVAAQYGSGRYLSPAVDLAGATSWLPFTAGGSADGGGLTYELYIDTDTAITPGTASTFVSSQTLTSGMTPTISTGAYAFLAATMTSVGPSWNVPDPYVSEWQLAWGEGSISNIVSSEFYNQKYYSAISLGGGSNDTILVFDQNGAWTKYTGLEPYFLAKYRTNLLMGVAGAGDVVRLEEKNRYRDYDDAAISAFWLSKDFDMGYPLTTKSAIRYYLTGERAVGGNVTFGYGVDRGSLTSAEYALDAYSGFFRQVIKPTSLQFSEGLQHRFRVSDDTLGGAMSVLSITGQWRKNTNP